MANTDWSDLKFVVPEQTCAFRSLSQAKLAPEQRHGKFHTLYQNNGTASNWFKSLSFTITGGAAPILSSVKQVAPKTWRI